MRERRKRGMKGRREGKERKGKGGGSMQRVFVKIREIPRFLPSRP